MDDAPIISPPQDSSRAVIQSSSDTDSAPGSPDTKKNEKKNVKKTTKSTFATLSSLQQEGSSDDEGGMLRNLYCCWFIIQYIFFRDSGLTFTMMVRYLLSEIYTFVMIQQVGIVELGLTI